MVRGRRGAAAARLARRGARHGGPPPVRRGSTLPLMLAPPPKLTFDTGGAFLRDTRAEVEAVSGLGRTRFAARCALREGSDRARADRRPLLCSCSHARAILGAVLCLAALAVGSTLDRLLHPARREPRRLLPQPALEPPAGLDVGRVARVLELRVAREAQRRASHVHEHRRLRRGLHADAVHAFRARQPARPWYRYQHLYIWPLYLLMGFAGRPWATSPRSRADGSARARCGSRAAGISRVCSWGRRSSSLWALVIPPRLSMVGGARRIRLLLDGDEPDHGDHVPARALRRGGDCASSDDVRAEQPEWAVHEVETTVDFCPAIPC